MKQKITIGSLYAGIGGIEKGFDLQGYEVLWANEYDKWACKTYRENFGHIKLYECDILNALSPKDVDKVDLITAGFPCQPFSVAGYQKGFGDQRGNHFFRIMDFVNYIKPKAIFLENVKHFLHHDNGRTWEIVRRNLIGAGYEVRAFVMNTMEYGNIPQNRERTYIVCLKNNYEGNSYNPFNYFLSPRKEKLTKRIENIILEEKVDKKYYYGPDKYMYRTFTKEMKSRSTIYQWRRVYVRENKNKACPTLTANMGTGGHNVPLIKTEYGIRKLTPLECFKFQGFEDIILPNNVSDSHLYKQAGNSVSVPVIRKFAQSIYDALIASEIIKNKVEPSISNIN